MKNINNLASVIAVAASVVGGPSLAQDASNQPGTAVAGSTKTSCQDVYTNGDLLACLAVFESATAAVAKAEEPVTSLYIAGLGAPLSCRVAANLAGNLDVDALASSAAETVGLDALESTRALFAATAACLDNIAATTESGARLNDSGNIVVADSTADRLYDAAATARKLAADLKPAI